VAHVERSLVFDTRISKNVGLENSVDTFSRESGVRA